MISFRTTIELGGKTATGFRVPSDVVDGLGSGAPDDLAALDEVPGAKATFDALSFGKRRERVTSVESAKRDETRWRRIEKVVEELRA